ncbi:transcription elongation factor GreAB (plasmid) [Neorhizobium sp. SOG26]|uniref:transcription elongation factor GreAB n=1 Tax=Neorhizobium sp. SOG26 TaxID=2060726 RepID=UPI000E575A25|nr:transcription elongation factor GreAB [Neorhizobium sp. SOG26]AXV18068.1 transcription elongation factor GreAB [Neorhizobium sp. SOG26]
MSREAFCQLTAGDLNVLMSMLDQENDFSERFLVLLREKLNHSSIFFREDIPANVVTIDSQVFYQVNGVQAGPHVLVRNPGDDLPNFAISVQSLRGLALLGLAVGESTEICTDDGYCETITVEKVVFQPEAEARRRSARVEPRELLDHAPQILSFRPKPRRVFTGYDDDPGPSAA